MRQALPHSQVSKQRRAGGGLQVEVQVLQHGSGHVHQTHLEERKHSVIIHPGSWRDEYRLDRETGMLTPRTKNYVRIQVAGERLHWELVPVQIQRSTILFKDVVKNERAAVCKAAAEENFSLPFAPHNL